MATATEMIENLSELLENAKKDAAKHDKGQYAAGTRLRKLFSDITKQCKTYRLEIQSQRSK